MVSLAVVLLLAAAPPLESRVFIAAGARTEAQAKALRDALKLPQQLVLAPGYPKLVRSDSVGGLNPGFVLVVLGACADQTAAQTSHSAGLAALIQRGVKGAYAKPVAKQDHGTCPLWLEPSDDAAVGAVQATRDDVKALLKAALVLEDEGDLVGAAILLRRALALGAEDTETLERSRKVEFLMEDLATRLPK